MMADLEVKLRRELEAQLNGLRASMSALRLSVQAAFPVRPKPRAHPAAVVRAAKVRRLDAAYTALTGIVLDINFRGHGTAPRYAGPMYMWRAEREDVRNSTVQMLKRLRKGQPGIQCDLFARNYFASIWPEGAPWPEGIERPFTPQAQEDTP